MAMQTTTLRTGRFTARPLAEKNGVKRTLPENCVSLDKFKKEFFRQLKKKYGKI